VLDRVQKAADGGLSRSNIRSAIGLDA